MRTDAISPTPAALLDAAGLGEFAIEDQRRGKGLNSGDKGTGETIESMSIATRECDSSSVRKGEQTVAIELRSTIQPGSSLVLVPRTAEHRPKLAGKWLLTADIADLRFSHFEQRFQEQP